MRWRLRSLLSRRSNGIILLPAMAAMMLCVSDAMAQARATATATVTVTIVPAPGINFTLASEQTAIFSTLAGRVDIEDDGMIFRSSEKVVVRFKSTGAATQRFIFEPGQSRKFTARELRTVTLVSVVYVGT